MAIEQPRLSHVNPIPVLVVLAVGTFMTLLDLTIVNVAIPSILDGLNASLDQILWVLNGYSLAYAVLLITTGRLGDIVGPRNLFVVGMGGFTVASALSGLAQDPTQLILARAAQGLGAAILAPQGMPILLSIVPPKQRGSMFAIFGILAGVAVAAGPTLGGFLVTHFGWRSIFYVNLPVGTLTIVAAMLIIPDLRPGRRHRLDFLGVGLATAGLLAVVYGLIEGERYNWEPSPASSPSPRSSRPAWRCSSSSSATRRRVSAANRCCRSPSFATGISRSCASSWRGWASPSWDCICRSRSITSPCSA